MRPSRQRTAGSLALRKPQARRPPIWIWSSASMSLSALAFPDGIGSGQSEGSSWPLGVHLVAGFVSVLDGLAHQSSGVVAVAESGPSRPSKWSIACSAFGLCCCPRGCASGCSSCRCWPRGCGSGCSICCCRPRGCGSGCSSCCCCCPRGCGSGCSSCCCGSSGRRSGPLLSPPSTSTSPPLSLSWSSPALASW